MHESKALCFEVKICVRFGVIFCKKVFTFAIFFSFFGGDFGEIFVAAVSGEVSGAISGCGVFVAIRGRVVQSRRPSSTIRESRKEKEGSYAYCDCGG